MATRTKRNRAETKYSRPHQDWHGLLDELTMAYAGEDATVELLDEEFGDEFEAERMPLAYIEYDEHADVAAVAVGGRDGRYPVVLRHSVEHPSAVLADSEAPGLPLAVEIVGGDGSRTLVSVFTRAAESNASSGTETASSAGSGSA